MKKFLEDDTNALFTRQSREPPVIRVTCSLASAMLFWDVTSSDRVSMPMAAKSEIEFLSRAVAKTWRPIEIRDVEQRRQYES